jgi:hypothetical protein
MYWLNMALENELELSELEKVSVEESCTHLQVKEILDIDEDCLGDLTLKL